MSYWHGMLFISGGVEGLWVMLGLWLDQLQVGAILWSRARA